MSSSSNMRILAFKAAAAMARGVCVKAGADREHVAVASAATDKIVGISNTAPTAADEIMEVAMPGGGGKGLVAGSVSFGDLLTSDGDGKLVATTSATNRWIAMAMEDGAANDLISVEVMVGLI